MSVIKFRFVPYRHAPTSAKAFKKNAQRKKCARPGIARLIVVSSPRTKGAGNPGRSIQKLKKTFNIKLKVSDNAGKSASAIVLYSRKLDLTSNDS